MTQVSPRLAYGEVVTLLLGPALRHVSDTTALIWVQTEHAGTVEVLGCSAPTFEVQGHHFALVTVTGLTPDTVTEYEVRVNGLQVWPLPDSRFPRSVIRTRGPESKHRLRAIFGSCRYPKTDDDKVDSKLGLDALDSYADRMAGQPVGDWPDALILLGDQLYADELTPETRRRVAGRRTRRNKQAQRPPDEVVSFAEYERLYRHSWGDPEIRWLMSTVPTAMIFDDHDIRDDWNTSESWRVEVNAKPWWRDRIQAGLASYWVYQHLGNLSPAELADNEDYERLLSTDGDTWPFLMDLADRADYEVDSNKGVRFSYRWDLGRSRLIMVDSRNGRILDSGQRMMIGDREFEWLEDNATERLEEIDHLLLASSLPWLLPPVIGDLQSVNERMADRPGWRGHLGETATTRRRFRALGGIHQVFPAADRTDRASRGSCVRARHRQRALRRCAPQLRRPRRSDRPGIRSTGSRGRASTGLFAGAQLRARVRQTGIQARVVELDGRAVGSVGAPPRGTTTACDLDEHLRPIVRQHNCHTAGGRPQSRGVLRATPRSDRTRRGRPGNTEPSRYRRDGSGRAG